MAVILSWRCGTVDIQRSAVEGALVLARGPKARLERALFALARHAYDGKTLLVPGVPEASNDEEALEATIRFQDELRKRLQPVRKGAA